MKNFPPYEILWNTNPRDGLPWREDFITHNPGIAQHVCNGPAAEGDERVEAWRNCDRQVRDWWRENRAFVATEWVVILEWDVLCLGSLAEALGRPRVGVKMMGAAVMQGIRDRAWPCFQEVPNLPREMQAAALGLVPFGVVALHVSALDGLAHEDWDDLYAEDVMSELRTPTLLASMFFKSAPAADLKNVGVRALPHPGNEARGIYHPVKSR